MLKQLPAVQDIEVVQGDDFVFSVDVGVPVNGKTFLCSVFIEGVETAITIVSAGVEGNAVQVSIPAALTATITGISSWTFAWIVSGKKRTLIRGSVRAFKNV